VGSLPPDLVFFPRRLFSRRFCLSLFLSDECVSHKVRKWEKTTVQSVVFTFFTVPAAFPRRAAIPRYENERRVA
jgi:hypothetical protein